MMNFRRSARRGLVTRLAALVAGLIVASGLVIRLSSSLTSYSPESQRALGGDAGITIDTDVGQTPLFDDVLLQPGTSVTACVEVTTGAALQPDPVQLRLQTADQGSALADRLLFSIESGTATALPCAERTPEESVAERPLGELMGTGADSGAGWVLGAPDAGRSQHWYRFTATLPRDVGNELQGRELGAVGLVWETAVPSVDEQSLGYRSTVFAANLARNALLPFLSLIAGSILFLGIQDRIDRDDPKLQVAPVGRATVHFEYHPSRVDAH